MNILIIDDELLAREGLYSLVSRCLPEATVVSVASPKEAISRLEKGDVDLIFLDLNLGGQRSGIELLRRVKHELESPAAVIVVSGVEDQTLIQDCFRYGAVGFIEKRTADYMMFRAAMEQAQREGIHIPQKTMRRLRCAFEARGIDGAVISRLDALPPRQRQIGELIAAGASNKRIARELGIAETSVKTHVSALFRRFQVATRLEFLALLASSSAVSSAAVRPAHPHPAAAQQVEIPFGA